MPGASFALRDQDGNTVRASDLRGRPAVVSFLYTRCRDTCPLIADQVRGALDDLGRDDVPFVAVSVDPAGDTPDSARSFLLRHGLTGRARYLLGTRAQLAPVWRQFGIRPQRSGNTRSDDHSASTVVLDAHGVQRVGFTPDTITPEGVAHDVRALAR
jgi:protein SCO1/2